MLSAKALFMATNPQSRPFCERHPPIVVAYHGDLAAPIFILLRETHCPSRLNHIARPTFKPSVSHVLPSCSAHCRYGTTQFETH